MPSNFFTPFKLTNEGIPLLAFPWDQAPQVLYRVLATPHLEARIEIKERTITNFVERETLRIQYITNSFAAKKEKIEGRIIGGLVGGLVTGTIFGTVFSSTLSTTSIQTLGIGLGAGLICFGIGCLIDLFDHISKSKIFRIKT